MSIVVRDDWKLDAACRGHDPEWWSLDGPRDARYRVAHTICGRCPVRVRCYQYGVDTGATGMIYGGVNFGASRPKNGPDVPQIKCKRCGMVAEGPRKGRKKFCSARCRLEDQGERRRAEQALRRPR